MFIIKWVEENLSLDSKCDSLIIKIYQYYRELSNKFETFTNKALNNLKSYCYVIVLAVFCYLNNFDDIEQY